MGLLLIELALAGGCVYFGWRLLAGRQTASTIVVQRPSPSPSESAPSRVPVPTAPASAAPGQPGVASIPGLGGSLVERLDHDDLHLYQEQWRVINLLLVGIKRYIEQRLMPLVQHSLH